jgi:hypothetical protein
LATSWELREWLITNLLKSRYQVIRQTESLLVLERS